MVIEFKLPEVAEGVDTADIAELLVAEGDVIEADQIVMELETEKAVVELPCPHAGTVTKVHIKEGDSVAIGSVVLTIDATDAGQTVAADKSAEAAGAASASPVAAAQPPASAPSASPSPPAAKSQLDGCDRPPAPAGPSTRRLARKLGVDLFEISGSGSGGRITSEDVQAFVRGRMSQPAGAGAGASAPPLPDFSQFGPIERQPLSKIAKASASNLTMSWQVIPHVTQHDLADITNLEAARKRYIQSIGQSGPKVTMTAIVIKAAAAVLKQFPHFNSSLDPQTNELVLKNYYHIGCAVDTPNGLLVPVVRDVDEKTVVEVAAELTELAGKARDRKLKLKQMQGATFTITNLGGIGGTGFTPIVNYPEVAILGMSRSRKELQLIDGQPVERLQMPLSLSYDHRVINGADAARFVAQLCRMLSDSFELLVEC